VTQVCPGLQISDGTSLQRNGTSRVEEGENKQNSQSYFKVGDNLFLLSNICFHVWRESSKGGSLPTLSKKQQVRT